MLNKLKLLVPSALIAITLASCGKNNNPNKIKRVEYTPISGTTLEKGKKGHEVVDSIFYTQTEMLERDANKRRLKLPSSATINTTFNILLKGSIDYGDLHVEDIDPIEKNKYKMAWNVDKHYMEFYEDGLSSYIVKDENDVYWDAHTTLVDGKKKKERTKFENPFEDEDLEKYLRQYLFQRSSFYGVDIGLSGLGYNTFEYVNDSDKSQAIAGLFHTSNGFTYEVYDYLNEKAGDGHNLTYAIASNSKDTFSGELKGDIDVKVLKDNALKNVPEALKEFIEWLLEIEDITGNINFDLFAAWDKNYICQQEYIISAKDLHYINTLLNLSIDIKNTDIYFGEEASLECKVTDKDIQKILHDYPEAK